MTFLNEEKLPLKDLTEDVQVMIFKAWLNNDGGIRFWDGSDWIDHQKKTDEIWWCLHEDSIYRIGPKTIMVNGVECEMPLTKETIKHGSMVFIVDFGQILGDDVWNYNECLPYHQKLLETGQLFSSREGAQTMAKALLKPLQEAMKDGQANAD